MIDPNKAFPPTINDSVLSSSVKGIDGYFYDRS
jgi:hypothetical protein